MPSAVTGTAAQTLLAAARQRGDICSVLPALLQKKKKVCPKKPKYWEILPNTTRTTVGTTDNGLV